jgi:osomolarity two-component system response regulator SKN7
MLDTLPQQGFNPSSSRGGTAEEDVSSPTHEGLRVYTVGHLLPKGIGIGGSEDLQGWWAFDSETGNQSGASFGDAASGGQQREGYQDVTQFSTPSTESDGGNEEEVVQPTASNSLIATGTAASLPSSSSSGPRKLRVRRSTYVPGWAVPPRVLLVDDDAVSRKLSSKFLKVFGCTIDVAVDGVGAVNKMNLEKYDLVLMDIVMPKLDGVSATNLIRKFDQGTPIISMTSNSKPNEIMTYYSSGMNDILPKPFTKEGLLEMLEVCSV